MRSSFNSSDRNVKNVNFAVSFTHAILKAFQTVELAEAKAQQPDVMHTTDASYNHNKLFTCDVGYLCANFGLPIGLSVFDLDPTYATQTDVRQKHRLMPRLLGAGHNNITIAKRRHETAAGGNISEI